MKIQFILLFIIGVVFTSCKKNTNHPVPNVPFDFTINISLPSYSNLNNVGGYAYALGGSRGIVIYRRGIDEFIAFDRHSPADADGVCSTPLTTDTTNFLVLNDACNDAQFSLYDGSPISGSDFGLRQYQAGWAGSETVRISN